MNRALCLMPIALLIGTKLQTVCGADRPNFLIVMADDCTYNDLPVYGGQNVRTPNIDQLATQGLTFRQNLTPDEIYIEKHLMGISGDGSLNNPYWATWVREAWANPHTYRLVKRYVHRPPEQLYHTAEDPYELTNLAEDASFAEIKTRLSAELDRWMAVQGDPGAAQDTQKAIQAARQGKHLYFPVDP